MDLTLSESLYAYNLLLKQGKLLISEMASRDVDEEDTSIMKAFGYQYYYYYLYYYFNNIRQSRSTLSNLSQSDSSLTRWSNRGRFEDIEIIQNDFHSTLMESVYVGQFCDVIPRESSLAPVKLLLKQEGSSSTIPKKTTFAFTWNMFDSLKSVKIFTKVLCKDHNVPFNDRLPLEFEKQVLEASIVECDFALLVEMLAIGLGNTIHFHQTFKKKIRVEITPEDEPRKICEHVVWDLLNSDSKAVKTVKQLIVDFELDESQIGTLLYCFKREIMSKKKELVMNNSLKLLKFSQKHNLRTPFICRKRIDPVEDDGPFLLTQTMERVGKSDEQYRTSYKERLKVLFKLSKELML